MCDESLRAMVASRLYNAPSADTNTDAVDDMVSLELWRFKIGGSICCRVASASDLQSSVPGFKSDSSHFLDLFSVILISYRFLSHACIANWLPLTSWDFNPVMGCFMFQVLLPEHVNYISHRVSCRAYCACSTRHMYKLSQRLLTETRVKV